MLKCAKDEGAGCTRDTNDTWHGKLARIPKYFYIFTGCTELHNVQKNSTDHNSTYVSAAQEYFS